MKYQVENDNTTVVLEKCNDIGLEEMLKLCFAGEKAWILFWEQYRVEFAWYDGSKIHWHDGKKAEEKYLLEARIFHETKEGYLRYVNEKKYGRILQEVQETFEDTSSVKTYKKISEPYMWGSIVKDGAISEERGMTYHLPCAEEATNFGYKVMQYYLPDPEDGMLRMMDYRMAGIFQEIKKNRKYLEDGGVQGSGL